LELGDVKKSLAILLVLISVQLVFAWTDGQYIKSDANKLYSLDNVPQYKAPVKVDANGDGDIEDEVDYVLYNELYVLEACGKLLSGLFTALTRLQHLAPALMISLAPLQKLKERGIL
jgi:hypothetical protein